MADFMLPLIGTPDEVQAMRNVASRIEGATAYREKRITDGEYHVWYRSTEAPNDLLAAIKRKAGLTKRKSKARKKATFDEGQAHTTDDFTAETPTWVAEDVIEHEDGDDEA